MASELLKVEGLDVAYPGPLTAVSGVRFHMNAGEIVGVVGESGCGKSTLASAIMGLPSAKAQVTAGSIRFQDRELVGLSEDELRRLWGTDISMVFQDPGTSLNPVLTIGDQLLTPLRQRPESAGKSAVELQRQAVAMLERVGIPDPQRRMKSYPHEFSGGMRQRVMIAMALLSNPSLLIADEPTSALDVTLKAQINELLSGLRDELGTSILYITHDLGIVAQVCDRVLVMYAGQIVESGTVRDIFTRPAHPYTRALLAASPSAAQQVDELATIPGQVPGLAEMPSGCRFADRCAFAQDACRAAAPAMYGAGGHEARCFIHSGSWDGPELPADWSLKTTIPTHSNDSATGAPLVEARNLQVHFKERRGLADRLLRRPVHEVRAVDGIDLSVHEGEIVAIVGESGSGKTTLGRTILRLQEKTGGQLTVAGTDLATLSAAKLRANRAGMQMIYQDAVASLSPRMRVRELLLEPFTIHGRRVADPTAKVRELLKMVGLSETHELKHPHELSGGQARRVGIARALALEPRLLVADEPTAGLDVSVGAGILNLLRQLNRDTGLSLVLITHDMNIIRFMAHRVAVMNRGRIVESGATREVMDNPQHPYTRALLNAVALPHLPPESGT